MRSEKVRSVRTSVLFIMTTAAGLTAAASGEPAGPEVVEAAAPTPARPRRLLELVAPPGLPAESAGPVGIAADPWMDDFGLPGAAASPVPLYCFDPSRPVSPEIMAAINQAVLSQLGNRYDPGSRWAGDIGSPVTLTWSLVPDGTIIPSSPGNTAPSNLFAAMDAKFSGPGLGGRSAWIAQIYACFNRWAAITGTNYIRVQGAGTDWDDGAQFPLFPGQAGVRGDIRIGGCSVDGAGGGVLAFAFMPFNGGDMVLDTAENFGDPTSSYRLLRNTVMHEHGHTLGMPHMCSSNSNQLMEPFLDMTIDGPQHDDIRAGQRSYGDAYEPNNTLQTATDLEIVPIGQTVTIGLVPGGRSEDTLAAISVTGDIDLYKFTVSTPTEITIQALPAGLPYDDNTQEPNGTCNTGNTTFSRGQADLTIAVLDAAGTVLYSQDNGQIGDPEFSLPVNLGVNGVYYVRVAADGNVPQTQGYQLQIRGRQGCAVPTVSPVAQTACLGGTASFTVAGSGTSAVRWRRNGVDIPGSNVTTLTLNPVTASSAGTYECVVSTNCGLFTSNTVTLMTTSGLPIITTQPVSGLLCPSQNATLSIAATNAAGYQWRLGGAVIAGATASSYTTTTPGTYDCIVTNICGGVTSSTVTLTNAGVPVITQQPFPQIVCSGQPASISVVATGQALSYQWFRNDSLIPGNEQVVPGATSSVYAIASMAQSNAGAYFCRVSNACGSINTNTVLLNFSSRPSVATQPASQSRCAGQTASFFAIGNGVPLPSYQWRRNGVSIPGATNPNYSTQASAATAGTYTCVMSNGCGTATTNDAVLTVNSTPSITVQPALQGPCPGGPATFSVTATGGALAYQWRRNGVDIPGATASAYTIAAVSPSELGDYSCLVTNPCGSATSASAALTLNAPPTITAGPASQNVCPSGSGPYSLSVTATGQGLTYQWRVGGVIIPGATSSTLTVPTPTFLAVYDCIVTNPCGNVTSSGATFTTVAEPSITTHPAPQSACESNPASFSVAATGTGPLTYQWRVNGANISGATSESYLIASVTSADAGNYDCVVTNACSNATSNPAALTVNAPPSITANPSTQTVCETGSASFSVTASGTEPLDYQWRLNGVDIPGAESATYIIASVGAGDVGSYDCVVTNPCSSVTSSTALLTVCEADFNCSGALTVQDIFDFLAAYFSSDPRGDFNASGAITVQDIFDFLAAYFAGCA